MIGRELALVPLGYWVALGTILALAGLVAGVRWGRLLWLWMGEWLALLDPRRWQYSRQQARHVVALTEAEGRDFYGSMTLDGERAPSWQGYTHPMGTGWLPADPVPWEDLRSDARLEEPTAAEVAASRAAHGYIPELDAGFGQAEDAAWTAYSLATDDDPGPGGPPWVLVPPGPDQDWPVCEHGWPGNRCGQTHPYIAEPARLADTGDIAAAHQSHPRPACPRCGQPHKEPHCADGYEWGPWPSPDLERLAWLDAQLEAHLEWARGMRGQVTGWGLDAAA